MSDSAPFGRREGDPYAEQRELFELLSQETRHGIIQTVLGHPDHLVSLDELAFAVRKSKPAILDQLDVLREHDVLSQYDHPGDRQRGHPESYYGPTDRGITVLAQYNYLRAVPVLRALYDNTDKTEQVERHENAPRPPLPESVRDALHFDPSERKDEMTARLKNVETETPEPVRADDTIDDSIPTDSPIKTASDVGAIDELFDEENRGDSIAPNEN